MPVNQLLWRKWKREHELFHLCHLAQRSADELEHSIRTHGLLPSDEARPGIGAGVGSNSRPGFVYLATREYMDALMVPARGLLFSVDADALNPALIYGDEDIDGFRYAMEKKAELIPDGLTISEWAHERNFGARSSDVAASLKFGTLTYRGVIAPEALRLVERDYSAGWVDIWGDPAQCHWIDLCDERSREICDEWGIPFIGELRQFRSAA